MYLVVFGVIIVCCCLLLQDIYIYLYIIEFCFIICHNFHDLGQIGTKGFI